MIFFRITFGQFREWTHGGEVSSNLCAGWLNLKRNHIEAGSLWAAGVCHLIDTVFNLSAGIAEIADVVVVQIGFATRHIVGHGMHRKVKMQFVQLIHRQAFQIHQHFVEIFGLALWIAPNFVDGLDVIVFLTQIHEKHIGLIAVPLMGEGIIVRVAEEVAGAAFREDFFWIGIQSLPVCGRFPNRRTIADGIVKTCVDTVQRTLI